MPDPDVSYRHLPQAAFGASVEPLPCLNAGGGQAQRYRAHRSRAAYRREFERGSGKADIWTTAASAGAFALWRRMVDQDTAPTLAQKYHRL